MNKIFDGVPLPHAETEYEYVCGDGEFMITYNPVKASDFTEYCDMLQKQGFFLYNEGKSENCEYKALCKGISLYIYFVECENRMRIIASDKAFSYCTSPENAGNLSPVLWQFEVDHSLIDCGMCYIVRCCDGSFFVVDTPHFYSVNDDVRIIEFLKKVSGEEKPRVSCWFFTHGHDDHIAKFNDILKYHYDEISIDSVCFNLPDPDNRDAHFWDVSSRNLMAKFRQELSLHPEIKIITPHTGMKFFVKNLELDVLCTHEDIYPAPLEDFNNTSTAVMMTAAGSKVLFPGDCAVESDKIFISRYKSSLKCDVVQVSHHGHRGTSPEFYRRAGAECALFPVTVIKYDEEWPRQEANRTAVEIAKEFHIASDGTVEIPLPYRFGQTKVWPDETFEDFEGIHNLWGYEYTEERKKELREEFLKRKAD